MYDLIHNDPQKSSSRGNKAPFGPHTTSSLFPKSFPINNNSNHSMRHPTSSDNSRSSFSVHAYPTAADVFPTSLTSPTLPHQQLQSPSHSYSSYGSNMPQQQQQPRNQFTHHGSAAYATPFSNMNGMHVSQTPYGPHVQSNGPPALNDREQVLHPQNGAPMGSAQEEINTIFVVGFPEDMEEREFRNMFTFSPGFEAATLKIPNKEYTAYGGVGGNMRGSISYGGFDGEHHGNGPSEQYNPGGVNDPYNLVTIAQGGVIVDGGRDGLTSSWPNTISSLPNSSVLQDEYGSQANAGQSLPPRKQIIGFAKFKSRGDALLARDGLQGRRVDIEKGAVLKAEMAKKNLHTKRGVGPVVVNGVEGMTSPMGMMSPPTRERGLTMDGGLPPLPRDRGMIDIGMGSGMFTDAANRLPPSQWREPRGSTDTRASSGHVLGMSSDDEDGTAMRRRDGVINAMGLGGLSRGPRERAEDEERRRKDTEARLRSTNTSAFDAFHSVPPSQSTAISRHPSNSLLSPSEVAGPGLFIKQPSHGLQDDPNVAAIWDDGPQQPSSRVTGPWEAPNASSGPWTDTGRAGSWRGSSSPTRDSFSPTFSMASSNSVGPSSSMRPIPSPSGGLHDIHEHSYQQDLYQQQPQQQQQHQTFKPASQPSSSPSSVNGGGSQGSGGDDNVVHGMNGLALNTQAGDTSPQLPSPSSGGSGGNRANTVDQNPPINTLYVGNLPTSAVPSIYPPNYLEDALRELFQRRPGFQKLCFRQKSNGPMCFVEFEDVSYATKTLNDLYGDTLNGIIKGGGIRLSYSKNPLGVRTPTSGGNGTSLQQQQQLLSNGTSPFPADAFQTRSSVDSDPQSRMRNVVSPPPSSNSYGYMTSPPPRFFSPPLPVPSSFGGSSAFGGSFPMSNSTNAFPRASAQFNGSNTTALGGYDSHVNGSALSPMLKGSGAFSPFTSSFPSTHSMIPDQSASGSDSLEQHFHQQHHHNNIEAASRAA